jgi:phospholipase/carboxylesterase
MNATMHPGNNILLTSGIPVKDASGAVVLLHGRGGSAEDILSLSRSMYRPELAYLAPQAPGHSWYPNSFLSPIDQNEPWLSSSLRQVGSVLKVAEDAQIPQSRIVLCGFSQGACLATEFVARHPQRYAGLIAFTGGLIGPPGATLEHPGDLAGTPALFSSGDPDPHVPWQRLQESAAALIGMGAVVTVQRFPGRPHTITPAELNSAKCLIEAAFGQVI